MMIKRRASHAIRRTFRESVTIVSSKPGAFNQYGEFEPGESEPTAIRCATAPLDGEELKILPEGFRVADGRKFWLLEAITTDDWIVYPAIVGQIFRVIEVRPWDGFFEVVAVAQNVTPNLAPDIP